MSVLLVGADQPGQEPLHVVNHGLVVFTICYCAGEDVGHYGGSYKVTYDLHKKYGDLRLLDTPICGTSLSFSKSVVHVLSPNSQVNSRSAILRLSDLPNMSVTTTT